MARVVTPTAEQWDMLRDLGFFSDMSLILVHPEAAEKHGIVDDDERLEDYEFGGEADIWMDVVTATGHHTALDHMEGNDDE